MVNIDDVPNLGLPRGPGKPWHDVSRLLTECKTGKCPDGPVLPVIPVTPVSPSSPVSPRRPGGPGDPLGPLCPAAQMSCVLSHDADHNVR